MSINSPLLFSRQWLSSGPYRTSVFLARHFCHQAPPRLLPLQFISVNAALESIPCLCGSLAKASSLSLLEKPPNGFALRISGPCERFSRTYSKQLSSSLRSSSSSNSFITVGEGRIPLSLEDTEGLSSSADGTLTTVREQNTYVVVNFYHFTELTDPRQEVAQHVDYVKEWDLKGRIYINEQGINAQLSGPREEAVAYAEWVAARMPGLGYQVSPSPDGHAFPRLRLRYKPSLVQVSGGTQGLPLTDPRARAVPLSPREWRERIEGANVLTPAGGGSGQVAQGAEGTARRVLLLDVRNGYEWDVGHFVGAERPEVDCFKETDFGISTAPEPVSKDPLAGVDREKTDILMYCTGGIRCDVYSTMLRERGFHNLYTLEGGVAGYLKEEQGSTHWAGNLFVFDSRLAVTPAEFQDGQGAREDPGEGTGGSPGAQALQAQALEGTERESPLARGVSCARCRVCGAALGVKVRHRNCANTDCNELFLGCGDCVTALEGCCCSECRAAPRLRPLVRDNQYQRWHWYRDADKALEVEKRGPSQRALNKRRRREQRKLQEAESKASLSMLRETVEQRAG